MSTRGAQREFQIPHQVLAWAKSKVPEIVYSPITALLFIQRKMIPFGAYHVLFLYPTRRGKLGKFVNLGFSKWHKTNEEKRNHITNDYHGDAMLLAEGLKKRFENTTETLPFRVVKGKQERYVKYRSSSFV